MGACADALRELRDIDAKLAAIPTVSKSSNLDPPELQSQQVRVVRLVEQSECPALHPLRGFVAHDDPRAVLLGWRGLVVDGLEPHESTLPKVSSIHPRPIGQRQIISTTEARTSAPSHYENPWIDHARRVVAVLIARVERIAKTEPSDPPKESKIPELVAQLNAVAAGLPAVLEGNRAGFERVAGVIESLGARDDDDAPAVKLPELKPHDRQAWQLATLHGMTQDKVAAALNKEHGTTYTQGQVSRMITRAKAHADANGLAEKVGEPIDRPRTVDPERLELGARVDKRKPRPSDMARANDDDE